MGIGHVATLPLNCVVAGAASSPKIILAADVSKTVFPADLPTLLRAPEL